MTNRHALSFVFIRALCRWKSAWIGVVAGVTLGILSSGGAAATTGAQGAPHPRPPTDTESSLFTLVDEVARVMEARAVAEDANGQIHIDVTAARGVDARKVDRAFTPRLLRRLRRGKVLTPVSRAGLRARVVLSLEGARLWVVGQLEGGPLVGPSAFAIKRTLDRELESFFGIAQRAGATGWVLERIGPVASGALDLTMLDLDEDGRDEIVILGIDGVRVYRYGGGDARPRLFGPVRPLVGDGLVWPRLVAGWVAALPNGDVSIATTAGHALTFDLKRSAAKPGRPYSMPVRQPFVDGKPAPLFLAGERGTPSLSARDVRDDQGRRKPIVGVPPRVRDLVRFPGPDERLLWVGDDGHLGGKTATRSVTFTSMERVGDRVVLGDFDDDGDPEVVTTSAGGPDEPDRIRVLSISPDFGNARLLFQHALSGGSIVGLAAGDIDVDGRADVVLIEETGQGEALLWRLEYQP